MCFRCVGNVCLVYGYDGSRFFELEFDTEEQYQATLSRLGSTLGWERGMPGSTATEDLIGEIARL